MRMSHVGQKEDTNAETPLEWSIFNKLINKETYKVKLEYTKINAGIWSQGILTGDQ